MGFFNSIAGFCLQVRTSRGREQNRCATDQSREPGATRERKESMRPRFKNRITSPVLWGVVAGMAGLLAFTATAQQHDGRGGGGLGFGGRGGAPAPSVSRAAPVPHAPAAAPRTWAPAGRPDYVDRSSHGSVRHAETH